MGSVRKKLHTSSRFCSIFQFTEQAPKRKGDLCGPTLRRIYCPAFTNHNTIRILPPLTLSYVLIVYVFNGSPTSWGETDPAVCPYCPLIFYYLAFLSPCSQGKGSTAIELLFPLSQGRHTHCPYQESKSVRMAAQGYACNLSLWCHLDAGLNHQSESYSP